MRLPLRYGGAAVRLVLLRDKLDRSLPLFDIHFFFLIPDSSGTLCFIQLSSGALP